MVKFEILKEGTNILRVEFPHDLPTSEIHIRNTWMNKFIEGYDQANGEELLFYKDLRKSLIDVFGTSTGFRVEQKSGSNWIFYLLKIEDSEDNGSFF